MATANYIAAAKKENRQSTILMQVENADAVIKKYTTKADWDGSVVLTNIDTAESVGDARPRYDQPFTDYGTAISTPATYGAFTALTATPTFDLYLQRDVLSVRFGFVLSIFGTDFTRATEYAEVSLSFYDAAVGGTLLATTDTVSVTVSKVGTWTTGSGFLTYYSTYLSNPYNFDLDLTVFRVASAVPVYMRPNITPVATTTHEPSYDGVLASTSTVESVPEDIVNATLTTSTIDLGAVPTADSILSVDDVAENGSAIVYTAFGGPADPPVNNLGVVSDGSTLTAYRYYRMQADFSSTNGGRGTIREISILEGDSAFRYYGTHKDVPFAGVKPYIVGGSLSPLTQKIDLKKGVSTTGQVSVKLAWVKDVSDLIATGYLKGKDVQLQAGFVGLASVDYEPVLTGTWYDHSLDDKTGHITVKVQDALKQFEKRKLPTETYNGSGVKTSTNIVYSNENLVDAIVNIYDLVGLRGRYVHADYATLAAGALSSANYDVTRTIQKPVKAAKMLDELAQSGGLFLVPLGNGQVKPVLYDATATATEELNIDEFTVSAVSANQKELFTRSYLYYNASSTFQVTPKYEDPSDEDDYDNAYALIDAEGEILYDPEKGEKQWFDKWKVGSNAGAVLASPPTALTELAARWEGWFSEPRHSFTLTNVPPRWANISPGDVVSTINHRMPVPSAEYDAGATYAIGDKVVYIEAVYTSLVAGNIGNTPTDITKWRYEFIGGGETDGKKYIITSRKFDANKAIIALDLTELPVQEGGVPTYRWNLLWILSGAVWDNEGYWLNDQLWEV